MKFISLFHGKSYYFYFAIIFFHNALQHKIYLELCDYLLIAIFIYKCWFVPLGKRLPNIKRHIIYFEIIFMMPEHKHKYVNLSLQLYKVP